MGRGGDPTPASTASPCRRQASLQMPSRRCRQLMEDALIEAVHGSQLRQVRFSCESEQIALYAQLGKAKGLSDKQLERLRKQLAEIAGVRRKQLSLQVEVS